MNALDTVKTPIHKEGRLFLAIFAVVTLGLFLVFQPLGWMGVMATAWCVYFFRDPERVAPKGDDIVISPADGTVSAITTAPLPTQLDMGAGERTRISIFLNVFNVHVNRVPLSGTVKDSLYVKGEFLNAADNNASERNERQIVLIEDAKGRQLVVQQVAGLVARRILCDLNVGDTVELGDRYGLIRFGSRMDIYLPEGAKPSVEIGQTMIGGETVIAVLPQ